MSGDPVAGRGAGSWVDPRQHPDPPLLVPLRRPCPGVDGVRDLILLCQQGRLYSVEQWIRDGKPLQALDYRPSRASRLPSPLQVAIESHQHDLAHLLLCNGYAVDLGEESPLNRALKLRDWGILDLLLEWGADPTRADPGIVLDTYQSNVMERFWELGLDFSRDHALAYCLAYTSSNRPAYGWARRHREDPRVARELALALGEAISEDRKRAPYLIVWAGADPHVRVPDFSVYPPQNPEEEDLASGVERAVGRGCAHLLRVLKPTPALDDFRLLWDTANDPEVVDLLAKVQPPDDWSRLIVRAIHRMAWGWGDRSAPFRLLELVGGKWMGRLQTLDTGGCADLRRALLKLGPYFELKQVLEWLREPEHCEPAIYAELTRTQTMKERLVSLGLMKRTVQPIRRRPRPKRRVPQRADRQG